MVRITKSMAESRLGDVPPDKQFWCKDNQLIKNLPELSVALKQMNDDIFRHHCNENRNDFSNWVRDVIGDDKLSRDLLKSTTQSQAKKSIDDRIAWLKNRV